MDKPNQIYNYLMQNCIGYDNRIKSDVLMDLFEIRSNKTFRTYIEIAREEFDYFIASEAGRQGGYWIASNKKDKQITYNNLNLRAKRMLETSKRMMKKKLFR